MIDSSKKIFRYIFGDLSNELAKFILFKNFLGYRKLNEKSVFFSTFLKFSAVEDELSNYQNRRKLTKF